MPKQSSYDKLMDLIHGPDPFEQDRKPHRLPLEHYATGDHEFLFTLCARHHGRPFLGPTLAEAIVAALLWRKEYHHWTLYSYCLMPDHLHFLVRLPSSAMTVVNAGARGYVPVGILEHVGAFKRYTTTHVWWKQGGQGALWQRSSYDRVLRASESVEAAACYVLNNPVRKGLVARWQDYAYSGIPDPW